MCLGNDSVVQLEQCCCSPCPWRASSFVLGAGEPRVVKCVFYGGTGAFLLIPEPFLPGSPEGCAAFPLHFPHLEGSFSPLCSFFGGILAQLGLTCSGLKALC